MFENGIVYKAECLNKYIHSELDLCIKNVTAPISRKDRWKNPSRKSHSEPKMSLVPKEIMFAEFMFEF